MQYNITLTAQELQQISTVMQDGPYRIVRPILDNIARQIDMQNEKQQKKDENNKE